MQAVRKSSEALSNLTLVLASLAMPLPSNQGLRVEDPPLTTLPQSYRPVGEAFHYPVRPDFVAPRLPPYGDRAAKVIERIREVLPQHVEANLAQLIAKIETYKQDIEAGAPNGTQDLFNRYSALRSESDYLFNCANNGHAAGQLAVVDISSGSHEQGGHTTDALQPEFREIIDSVRQIRNRVLAREARGVEPNPGAAVTRGKDVSLLSSAELTARFGSPFNLLKESFFRLTGKELPPGVKVWMKRSPEALAALTGVRASGSAEELAGVVRVVDGNYLLEYSVLAHEFGHLIIPAGAIARKAGASKEDVEELEETGAFLYELALCSAVEDEQLRTLLMRWNAYQSNRQIAAHCQGSRGIHPKAMAWAIAAIELYGVKDAIDKLATAREFPPELAVAVDGIREAYWHARLESERLWLGVQASQYEPLMEQASTLMDAVNDLPSPR